tara:strand:+ start:123627 stop:124745 length:1119 start_codon:yes stop_codon:yes gene_type:complete
MLLPQFKNQSKKTSPDISLHKIFSKFGPCHSRIVTFNPAPSSLQAAYPLSQPVKMGSLTRDSGHSVWYETFGDPTLPAVLLVHGGPGVPVAEYRQLIDPTKNYIIFVHQRGCGKSKPTGHLENNNTSALVNDLKAVLNHLKINKVAVQGHSWGGALGLVFAGTYPEMVDYILLRGPTNGDRSGFVRKLHITGPEQFSDYWSNLVEDLSDEQKQDLVKTLYEKIVLSKDEAERIKYMTRFSNMNDAFSTVRADSKVKTRDIELESNIYKLIFHYVQNNYFLGEKRLLELVKNIIAPIICLHGRHDRNCYPINSVKITSAAQNGLMIMVDGASHSALSPLMINAIVKTQAVMESNFRTKVESHQKKTDKISLRL